MAYLWFAVALPRQGEWEKAPILRALQRARNACWPLHGAGSPWLSPPPVPWQQAGCGDTAGPINLEVGTPPAGNGGHQARGEGCSEQERGEQALVGARPRVAAHLSGPDRLPSFCLPS